MSITTSKQKDGTLTLDGTAFECQQSSVKITPPDPSDDAIEEVLCGDPIEDEEVKPWKLALTAIQDFTNAAGFVKFTWDNHGDVVAFVWNPTGVAGPTFAGTVQVNAVEVGGEMNKRLTTEAEWVISGVPTWTPAA